MMPLVTLLSAAIILCWLLLSRRSGRLRYVSELQRYTDEVQHVERKRALEELMAGDSIDALVDWQMRARPGAGEVWRGCANDHAWATRADEVNPKCPRCGGFAV